MGNRRTKRVKRTKRTKRTKINRRTRRTKRLSRKTRRSRRMRGGADSGSGSVEQIKIGNEIFRPPNDYEKGDGYRIIGRRVCVEMNKDSEHYEPGTIISFEKVMRGASSHTIKFDNQNEVTPGVKLMRKTGTDPYKKNWKISPYVKAFPNEVAEKFRFTPEQLNMTTINDPNAGIWEVDEKYPGTSPLSGIAREVAAEAWAAKAKERQKHEALDRARKAVELVRAVRGD